MRVGIKNTALAFALTTTALFSGGVMAGQVFDCTSSHHKDINNNPLTKIPPSQKFRSLNIEQGKASLAKSTDWYFVPTNVRESKGKIKSAKGHLFAAGDQKAADRKSIAPQSTISALVTCK